MQFFRIYGVMLYQGDLAQKVTQIPMPGWKCVHFFRNGEQHLEQTGLEAWKIPGWNIAAVLQGESGYVVSREEFFGQREEAADKQAS